MSDANSETEHKVVVQYRTGGAIGAFSWAVERVRVSPGAIGDAKPEDVACDRVRAMYHRLGYELNVVAPATERNIGQARIEGLGR